MRSNKEILEDCRIVSQKIKGKECSGIIYSQLEKKESKRLAKKDRWMESEPEGRSKSNCEKKWIIRMDACARYTVDVIQNQKRLMWISEECSTEVIIKKKKMQLVMMK